MRAFYHGCGQLADVPSDSSVEVTQEQALLMLRSLRGTGSFLGLQLEGDFVLQFRYERGAIHTEILNRKLRFVESCTLSFPLAEDSIRAASCGKPIKQVAEEAYLKWQHDQLA
jgi:hypothetical protein